MTVGTIGSHGVAGKPRVNSVRNGPRATSMSSDWPVYPLSMAFVVLLLVALYVIGVEGTKLATVVPLLLAVLLIAVVWGRGPAIVAALSSSIVFNYLIIPPPYAFNPPTSEEELLLVGLLAVAFGLGSLTDRVRTAGEEAKELAASERLQKTLLNCISHDLRTPLTSVMGSLSTLLAEGQGLEEGVRRELLTIAYHEAKQLDRLVAQVLEMTRLEAGVVHVRRAPSYLDKVVESAFAQVQDPLDGRRCHVDVPAGLPTVSIDAVLFSHALINVLDNAIKYSPPGAPIEVAARRESRRILISVADRGIGIPAEQLGRVFEKFYRFRQAPASGGEVSGTGLGLAIAKGIVEAHGGRIWAEQREGGGTVIKIGLPAE